MNGVTARKSIDNWTASLEQLFFQIEAAAKLDGWTGIRSGTEVTEDPLGLGASVVYQSPILTLKKPEAKSGLEQRATFEPRHRFTVGAAGRLDVYSYPALREATILRIADTSNSDDMTWDEAEERVAKGSWKVFSPEGLPLIVDLSNDRSVCEFLAALVG